MLGGRGEILLCPNFAGSAEAPTTAKYGAVKNARAAASVAILISGLSLRNWEVEVVERW